ncbi:MAG: DUF460 domain-containing protein [Candidatus Micrarchaeota archaeon]|nr:DUF460 domain-containing protein [Candidatus Micrarchaeota archaeon]
MQRYLIAGIDPGATVGIALLDLSGKKIASASLLGGGISEAAKFIEQHGTPSLVACDVHEAPEMVLRLASYFSCKAYSPKENIREEEKRRIASGIALSGSHERDAYAAAVLAYRQSSNRLRQIDALNELSAEDKEKVKHLILKGYRIKDAFLEISGKQRESAVAENQPAKKSPEASPEELRRRISLLARENANLRMLAARLEAEKRQLEAKVRLLENGARQKVMRDSQLRKLRFKLGQMLKKLNDKNTWRKKGSEEKKQIPLAQSQPAKKDTDLNNLSRPVLDLEKIVEEYRRGRR